MPNFAGAGTVVTVIAAACALLMTAGLAMRHAGLVRARHALGMAMYAFAAIGTVTVTWTLLGFSLAFAPDAGGGLIGGLAHGGLADLSGGVTQADGDAPSVAMALLTMMIATFAATIVAGAAADRMKFGALVAFTAIWSVAVLPPVMHWLWSPEGWLHSWGALDSAGGAVVQVCAGASALALTLVLGPRRGWPGTSMRPHNTLFGLAGLLLAWVGWIVVAAAVAGHGAASAALAAHVAGVGGIAGWVVLDKRLGGKVTALGAGSGGLAGLAAGAAGASLLDPFAALLTGFAAGVAAFLAMRLKYRARIDDPTDAVAVHLTGGIVGMVAVGLVARAVQASDGTRGLGVVNAGDWALLGKQLVAVAAVAAFSFAASWIIAFALRAAMGLRVTPEGEEMGLDEDQHGQSAYEIRH